MLCTGVENTFGENRSVTLKKRIRDPLYGFIDVPGEYLGFIDHSFFQRLRWISQLPLEQLVYPAAQHSRFEHSLGTMHLAQKAACALVANSRDEFLSLASKDRWFKSLASGSWEGLFTSCAALSGLLHDVGHAPFSHTLEDASKHFGDLDFAYDHEKVGFHLVKRMFEDSHGLKDTPLAHIVLGVLNKNISREECSSVAGILRDLVDGPFDVDKGDYIRRDSYHCGVVYGEYDVDRLWDNVVITDTNRIGINGKGALEAWALRFARYRMYVNVYKHHVRNITDALLIDIIIHAFELLRVQHGSALKSDILPLASNSVSLTDAVVARFKFWTDNSLLKALGDLGNDYINVRIQNFLSRKLYKRCHPAIELGEYPDFKAEADGHAMIQEVTRQMSEKGIDFNYIIYEDVVPPVYEDEVQEKIRVRQTDGTFLSLAAYLGFARSGEGGDAGHRQEAERFPRPMRLHAFIEEASRSRADDVTAALRTCLAPFGVDAELS